MQDTSTIISKTVIKSIRIDLSLEKQLSTVSRKNRVTESAYVSAALRKQLLVEPLIPAFDGVTLESAIFRSIVELGNRETVALLGSEVARRGIPLALDLLDLRLEKQSFWIFLTDIAADCWHWFKIGLNAEGKTRVLLYHQFGMNWSVFLKSFLVEAYSLMSEAPPTMAVTERLVKFDWADGKKAGDS